MVSIMVSVVKANMERIVKANWRSNRTGGL